MRTVLYVSDQTAITTEAIGQSLLVQFPSLQYREIIVPYVDSLEKAEILVQRINREANNNSLKPIVFTTLVNPHIRGVVMTCDALVLDLFDVFLTPLEAELKIKPLHKTGRAHRISDFGKYDICLEAIHFTLAHDDGALPAHYAQSDVILTGLSRCGKTPTCLYLALQFGIRAVNYPLTEEHLRADGLPRPLRGHTAKLFALSGDVQRLHQIRSERYPGSRYASREQCRYELRAAEGLYRLHNIPFLNTSTQAIEEIAARIAHDRGLQRRHY
jgi:regulator of PEP synthase PpsR (kinase-PPPase family)